MNDTETFLRNLAAMGHSRTSAHKAAGMSWYTFRALAAEYPDIPWRTVGGRKGRYKKSDPDPVHYNCNVEYRREGNTVICTSITVNQPHEICTNLPFAIESDPQ